MDRKPSVGLEPTTPSLPCAVPWWSPIAASRWGSRIQGFSGGGFGGSCLESSPLVSSGFPRWLRSRGCLGTSGVRPSDGRRGMRRAPPGATSSCRARPRPPALRREQLRDALESFRRLGAAPWVAKAERELDASGERRERRTADVRELLTPQELQIALRVSEGSTTKEAAAALFISPRTVDAHLNRIYRKLGIRSRAELTRVVLEGGLPTAEGDRANEVRRRDQE